MAPQEASRSRPMTSGRSLVVCPAIQRLFNRNKVTKFEVMSWDEYIPVGCQRCSTP